MKALKRWVFFCMAQVTVSFCGFAVSFLSFIEVRWDSVGYNYPLFPALIKDKTFVFSFVIGIVFLLSSIYSFHRISGVMKNEGKRLSKKTLFLILGASIISPFFVLIIIGILNVIFRGPALPEWCGAVRGSVWFLIVNYILSSVVFKWINETGVGSLPQSDGQSDKK